MGKNKKTKKTSFGTISQPNASSEGSVTAPQWQKGVNRTTPLLKSGSVLKSTLAYPPLSAETNAVSGHTSEDPIVLNIDHSIARVPINLGITNVRQIMGCIKDGTEEVKDLILNECNMIYECKMCTSLFRSLANFIAHKRVYCKEHYCERMTMFDTSVLHFGEDAAEADDDDELSIADDNDNSDANAEDQNEGDSGNATAMSDLFSPSSSNYINDRSKSQKRKYVDECAAKIAFDKMRVNDAKLLDIKLSPIKSNPNAVFQRLANTESVHHNFGVKNDTVAIVTNQLPQSQNNEVMVTDKRLKVDDCHESPLSQSSEMNDENLKCNVCHMTFSTVKTLRVHIQTLHASKRIVYPCPLCSLCFKNLSNASRHIIQIHKKSKTQTITLKEVMKRRAYSTNSSENSSEIEDGSDDDCYFDNVNNDNNDNDRMEMQIVNDVKNVSKENNYKTNTVFNRNKTSASSKHFTQSDKAKGSRIPSTPCAYDCGHHFDWLPAKISHEKSCRKRAEMKAQVQGNCSSSSDHIEPIQSSKSSATTSSLSHHQLFMPTVPKVQSSNPNHSPPSAPSSPQPQLLSSITSITLPRRVEEQICQFIDNKSLRCKYCPNQDFMNLNQLVHHAVTHFGYHVFRCHGCAFHTIREDDMKNHLINNHNIGEDMIVKHYQVISTPSQPRVCVMPVKAKKSINGPNCGQQWNNTNGQESPKDHEKSSPGSESSLKIHLRPMENNSSKKCYKIVDK